ncbi:MAG: hypothetical protein AAGE80_09430 [Pseudomonadota bacterium]
MKVARHTVTGLFLGAFLAGTAAAKVIVPADVSADDFADLDCYDLTEERGWITEALTGTGDMQGIELTDADVSKLKGYLIAIDTSMLRKQCSAG